MQGGFDPFHGQLDYEHRPGQLEMAEMVHDAFESHHQRHRGGPERARGKRWRYLLPAICSGRRVVISTATKSLQEQLLPERHSLSTKTLCAESESGSDERRSNFLCLTKLIKSPIRHCCGAWRTGCLPADQGWAKLTETGDRAELTFCDDSELWGKLDARRETCHGQELSPR